MPLLDTITVINPTRGSQNFIGETMRIAWDDTDKQTLPFKIELIASDGTVQTLLSSTFLKHYNWNIAKSYSAGTGYRIRVTSYLPTPNIVGLSEPFALVDESIEVLTPNGGELIQNNQPIQINFTKSKSIDLVDIILLKNNAVDSTLASNYPYSSFTWTPNNTIANDYKIRVRKTTDNTTFDESNANFEIVAPDSITLSSPNGGEVFSGTNNIVFTKTGTVANVKIELFKNDVFHSTITSATQSTSFSFTNPSNITNGDDYKVKVTSLDNTGVNDVSSNTFTIKNSSTLYNDVNNQLNNNVEIQFGDAGENIKGDGTDLFINTSNNIELSGTTLDLNQMRILDCSRIAFTNGGSIMNVLDSDTMSGATTLSVSTSESVKAYVDNNRRWNIQTGGFRSNASGTTNYYFQYRPNGETWGNFDSSIGSITGSDVPACNMIAPHSGFVTKISATGYATDSGFLDRFRFYVFRGTPSNGLSSLSLTQIGMSDQVQPSGNTRVWVVNTDITSSNMFAQHDAIYVMLKKDTHSAFQDIFFNVTVSGYYNDA